MKYPEHACENFIFSSFIPNVLNLHRFVANFLAYLDIRTRREDDILLILILSSNSILFIRFRENVFHGRKMDETLIIK